MPVHDWTKVPAGIFHALHFGWIAAMRTCLNDGLLPPDYYALPEQIIGDFNPDVLTLQRLDNRELPKVRPSGGGVSLATKPPKVRFRALNDTTKYALRARNVVIRHVSDDRVVAMIEIVSPGNKSGQRVIESFIDKVHKALNHGIHLLIVDLFPPGPRDPQGIHRVICDNADDGIVFDPEKPLTCVSYVGVPGADTFLEPVAVGDTLPDMPLFLTPDEYVPLPLETTYLAAWRELPAHWRDVVAGGAKA